VERGGLTGRLQAGPSMTISGADAVVLARLLAGAIEGKVLPAETRELLTDIGRLAEFERAAAAARLASDRALTEGWLTVAEAAQLTGCTPRAIQRRAARGSVASVRRGRRLLVDAASLV
jgi:excisionase family DNA binding protein